LRESTEFGPIAAYIILAIALRPKPPALYASPDEEAFWRGVGIAPADTLSSLKRKFADLEVRLGYMEKPGYLG
jgi:phage shock protein C